MFPFWEIPNTLQANRSLALDFSDNQETLNFHSPPKQEGKQFESAGTPNFEEIIQKF